MRPLKRQLFTKFCVGMEAEHSINPARKNTMVVKGESIVWFLLTKKELLTFCLQENLKEFVECLSDKHWCSKLAYLANVFHELNFLNSGMQGRNKNILSSTDK